MNECDDWNFKDGDGCNSTCYIETGWYCTGGSNTARDYCYEVCGDLIWLGQHACDDGNLVNGDGCDSTCGIEPGWECVFPDFSYCYKAYRNSVIYSNITSNSSYACFWFNTTIQLDPTVISFNDSERNLNVEIKGPL